MRRGRGERRLRRPAGLWGFARGLGVGEAGEGEGGKQGSELL